MNSDKAIQDLLHELEIVHEWYEHESMHRCEDTHAWHTEKKLPGARAKNLFLRYKIYQRASPINRLTEVRCHYPVCCLG